MSEEIQDSTVRDYFSLLKPRVMTLVIFTGLVGFILAPGELHIVLSIIAILAISVGSGASGAINMWYDRDIDAIMSRTQSRPIPSGKVPAAEALGLGTILSVISVAVLGLATNWLAAILLATAIAFYVFIYTIWLKRNTVQNIVIGGAAGALPPMIGWAAVTGEVTIDSIILFMMIFLWTPPHFWALSIAIKDEYESANIPMLPVVKGVESTAKHVVIYTFITVAFSFAPLLTGLADIIYGIGNGILGALFIYYAFKLLKNPDRKNAMRTFGFSIIYLFGQFLLLILDKYI